MKPMKIIAIVCGVVAAALIGGVVIISALFDGARIKSELAKVVMDQKQRKLDITGDVSLSFWPNVAIKTGKLSLSERNSAENFLSIDEARISVAVMPLLSKQVVVNAVSLSGLKATLIKRKDGTLNIADLAGAPAAKETPTPAAPLQIDVASVKLANTQLTWRDDSTGRSAVLSDLDLSTGRVLGDTGKQTYVADAVVFSAKGKSGGKGDGKGDSDSFQIKLDIPKLSVSPEKQQISVGTVALSDVKLTLIKRKDGTLTIANLIDTGAAAATPAATKSPQPAPPMLIDVAGIKLANAQLVWRDEKAGTSTALSNLDVSTGKVQADTGKKSYIADAVAVAATGKNGTDTFELRFDAPKVTVTPDKAAGESVKLAVTLAGTGRNVALKLALSGVEGSAQALKIGKLALDLDAKANEASVKGQLESPVAVNLTAQTVALDNLAGKLDIAHPQMPMKQVSLPITGSLRADLAKSSANLVLGTQFDESKIALKLDVPKFAPLALGFDLEIDQLNLDKYLPPADKPAADSKVDPKVDLAALKGLNLNGNVRIGALQVSKVKIAKLNARLSAADGVLNVAPLSANLYEGTLNGSLSANANGNSLVVKQTLAGVQINPLMKDALAKDLLEGKGTVNLDVTMRGETVGALKKALAGSASLSLKDGALKGINLAQSLRDVKAKLGAKQPDTTQQAKAGEKTDFSELTGSFKIAAGVARNDDLAMKSPFLRLAGAGDIDIGNNQMNYLAKATVVGTTAGQGGKETDQLKGLTVPVRVTGPFDKLSYKIEFGNMVADAAKAKVEEKKAEVKQKVEEKKVEVQQKVEDKAKDKLKGLFKK